MPADDPLARGDYLPPPGEPKWSDDWQAPDGYRAVWTLADEDWRAGGGGKTCRSRGCTRPAVMRLNRWQRRRGLVEKVPMWWHYCDEHSFARVVHDGRVWQPGIEPIESTDNTSRRRPVREDG